MRTCLRIVDGPAAGRKMWLIAGQVAEIGRAADVDLSVPDAQMADIHFRLECDSVACRLQDVSGGRGVQVDGTPFAFGPLENGNCIVAGRTTFSVEIESAVLPSIAKEERPAGPAPAGSGYALIESATAAEVCEHFQLDEALPLLAPEQTPKRFLESIVAAGHYADAVRFLAHALPKREAIWWAYVGVEKNLGASPKPADREACRAALAWIKHPSEENRLPAMPAAEATNCETPAGLVAMSVFFSGGSLVDPEFEVVPPGPYLTAQTVSAAVSMTATAEDPAKISARFRSLLEDGVRIADGENPCPEEDDAEQDGAAKKDADT